MAGFLLGLTILTLMQNIPLQLFEREYFTSDITIGRATGIFTWAQDGHLKKNIDFLIKAVAQYIVEKGWPAALNFVELYR